MPKGEEARKKIVVLNACEQRALMQAAIGDQDPQLWLFVAIALGTGMRHSEILRIKWEDIDTEHRPHLHSQSEGRPAGATRATHPCIYA